MGDAESNTTKESLLLPVNGVEKVTWRDLRDGSFTEELKSLICFAAPMAAVMIAEFIIQVISMVMVGHLGNLPLASASLASSFCNVTGFSVIIAASLGLETLCGQAYGAKLYRKVGVLTYTAMFCLTLVCIPMSLIWLNMETLLGFLGQDPLIAHEAGRYAIWLIPALFSMAFLQPLSRYFTCQSLTTPLLIVSCTVVCIHVPLCWLLVYKSGLGYLGGAFAISLSNWIYAILLGFVMYFSSSCSETRAPITMKIFDGVGEFCRFAFPTAAMICLEWWALELMILLSGLLPNPQLETSVLSVCFQTTATLFQIPIAISIAASISVSNKLGAGNSRAAHLVVYAAMSIALVEALIVSTSLFVGRNYFGHIFSSDKETIDYVTKMAPLVSISLILDALQGTLGGIVRGCGLQHIGGSITLGSYYLWGIPIAATLAFWIQLKGVGLWIGIQAGGVLQILLLALLTSCINWGNQSLEARTRMGVTVA